VDNRHPTGTNEDTMCGFARSFTINYSIAYTILTKGNENERKDRAKVQFKALN
jgi:hypothetical protein